MTDKYKVIRVQSVLFDNKLFDATSARSFLKTYHMYPIKRVHKTENYLRYRLEDPIKNKKYCTVKDEVAKGVLRIIYVQ